MCLCAGNIRSDMLLFVNQLKCIFYFSSFFDEIPCCCCPLVTKARVTYKCLYVACNKRYYMCFFVLLYTLQSEMLYFVFYVCMHGHNRFFQ